MMFPLFTFFLCCCCFGLMLNVQVNNFFSHVGTEPPIPVYYLYFLGVNMSCSRTPNGDPSGARTPTSGSGVRGVNHQATAPPPFTVVKTVMVWFGFCLASRSTICQSCWDGATPSLVFTSTLGSLKCFAQGTLHGGPGVRTLDLFL